MWDMLRRPSPHDLHGFLVHFRDVLRTLQQGRVPENMRSRGSILRLRRHFVSFSSSSCDRQPHLESSSYDRQPHLESHRQPDEEKPQNENAHDEPHYVAHSVTHSI